MATPPLDIADSRDSQLGGTMFHGASNIKIVGGTFNAYGSGGTDDKQRITDEMALLNEKKRIGEAMALLASRAEKGAPHDAAAREDVPKCHERTRVAIIDGVHKWAHSEEPSAPPLMWMYGPAGSGKTTIMQTVAETFDKEKALAASFFFSKSSPARPKSKDNFVVTLAHQLSLHIPALQQPMADALANPSLLSKSLTKQLDALIVEPLNQLDPAEAHPRLFFLVDRLDECDSDAAQRDTLNLLQRLLDQTCPRLQIRILVASRFLSHIQAFFSQRSISTITRTTPLDNKYDSDKDITEYFRVEFERIRSEHPSRGGLPPNWPSASDIEILVQRASGQFIYSAVVVKFISCHDRHPVQSLKTITGLPTTDVARPYQDLDAVYHHVLSTVEPENLEFVQTLIGSLLLDNDELFLRQSLKYRTIQDIDSLFMLEPGETVARMNRMSPLIAPPYSKFSHASFAEYLQDYSRSNEFFLDKRKIHCFLARHWFHSFSTHFKMHPEKGNIPISIPEDLVVRHAQGGRIILQRGKIFLDVIYHCMCAEWTSELRQDVLQFDVRAAFRDIHAVATPYSHEHFLKWEGIIRWLNFISWMQEHHLLSLTETENILFVMEDVIRLVFLEIQVPSRASRAVAALLTLSNKLSIGECMAWYKKEDARRSLLIELLDSRQRIPNTCSSWLCKAMGVDIETSANGDIYADLALLYAQNQYRGSVLNPSNWPFSITHILTKASPSKSLAALLMKDFIQLSRTFVQIPLDRGNVEPLAMAIIIYLTECGVPFLSEHQHGPDFNPADWVCCICFLFDPLKAECPDIELSREPTSRPLASLNAQIVPDEVAAPPELEINGLRRIIPRLQLLWVQAWIVWFADIVVRFFPVVA